ncbi:MAG: hypothetical protein Tsb007_13970 [Rhizobacter sp.]
MHRAVQQAKRLRQQQAGHREVNHPAAQAKGVQACHAGNGCVSARNGEGGSYHKRPSSRTLSVYKVDRTIGQIVRPRPLWRYPSFPRYRGSDDVNSAGSFVCASS